MNFLFKHTTVSGCISKICFRLPRQQLIYGKLFRFVIYTGLKWKIFVESGRQALCHGRKSLLTKSEITFRFSRYLGLGRLVVKGEVVGDGGCRFIEEQE